MLKNVKDSNGQPYVNQDGTLAVRKDNDFYQKEEYTGKKDLIAYHNISQENLDKAIQLGGLAVPSIAVTKKETDFSNFGDITLLMPQDMVNPKETPVYTRDAWTGVFPGILKASDEIEEEGEMGGFPGMEDMMGEGGGEEKRPPQMPPVKPPQMPKQTQDSSYSNGWKTINGSKVHFKDGVADKGPKDMIGMTEAELLGKDDQAPMAWVDAPTFYPETNTKGHDKHHMEHAKEMGLTFKGWLKEASDTLNSHDKKIVKWMDAGFYIAFNTEKVRYAVGAPNGTIRTYFILHKSRRKHYIPKEISEHYGFE